MHRLDTVNANDQQILLVVDDREENRYLLCQLPPQFS